MSFLFLFFFFFWFDYLIELFFSIHFVTSSSRRCAIKMGPTKFKMV